MDAGVGYMNELTVLQASQVCLRTMRGISMAGAMRLFGTECSQLQGNGPCSGL